MKYINDFKIRCGLLVVTLSAICVADVRGDWVELKNRDVLQGQVISLDATQVKIQSETFGELMIPRDKVSLIGLGDRPKPVVPQANAAGRSSSPLSQALPSLQSPQLNALLQEALGGELGDVKQNLERSRQGLKELQEDLGPGASSDALGSYLQLFDVLSGIVPDSNSSQSPDKSPGSVARPSTADPSQRAEEEEESP